MSVDSRWAADDSAASTLVIDTNIVLDLFVFDDPAAAPLAAALEARAVIWLATAAMRAELERVLAYPKLVLRLERCGRLAVQVLGAFDRHARIVDAAPRCALVCSDPDDQCFLDLAAAHHALLLSKDRALLCKKKRLETLTGRPQTAI